MKPITKKPFILLINNKKGEEILETFDKNRKLESWVNINKNIRTEIERPDSSTYFSKKYDETNSIYKTTTVKKFPAESISSIVTKTLDLSEYPKIKSSLAAQAYSDKMIIDEQYKDGEHLVKDNINKETLIDIFFNNNW